MTRDLVAELQLLHRAAGRPSYRRISGEIRRLNHMPDTVSHETVSAILRGDGLARWSKVECVVRCLAAMAVHRPDQDEEVRRFHALWLAASDQLAPDGTPPAAPLAPPPAEPPHAEPRPAEPPDPQPPAGITPMGLAPHRNIGFTGREGLLQAIRRGLLGEPWQPLILYGLGGVGKTQLAVEYAHRHADAYDLVWWIAADDRSRATASLAALGERQDWPTSLDMAQTVTTVLTRLERGGVRWLLVLDNAGPPEELATLVPASGGHVVVTTRDAAWVDEGRAVEVDVLAREESIELLRARGHDIDFDEADQLAERLGDLPLALEQVAAVQSATRTPVREYLRQLDERAVGLLAAVQPGDYQATVATAFAVAADRVRVESLAAGQLLELLSCLGSEPITLSLLRRAGTRIAPPLGRLLNQPDLLDEAVRLLRRYGLVKVLDGGQALRVHRLVQAIVRDTLPAYARERAFDNARRLLGAANPGNPSDPLTWDMHAQIGPHLRPARVIETAAPDAREVVVHQATYLYEIGDFDGSRRLSDEAWTTWTRQGDAEDVRVFACLRRLVAALYALGRYGESRRLVDEAWKRLLANPGYGPDHPATLDIADTLAVLHRVFGRYGEALRLDLDRVERYSRIRGADHRETMLARNNLGASLRAAGDFRAAYDIDADLAESRRRRLGPDDQRTLLSLSNLARDLYGLGEYANALELQRSAWQAHRERLGDRHPLVLSAWRTIVLGLRKTGQVTAALEEGRRLYLVSQGHVGADHELSLAAMMTYANTLCAADEVSRAWNVATDAMDRYRRHFGERNPLTLAAAANQAIILRAMGERRRARQVGESSFYSLRQVLGQDHPYTIAAAVGLGNDLVLAHDEESARRLLTRTLDDARRVRGEHHPETLTCALNLGLLSADDPGSTLLGSSLAELRRLLGPHHPLVAAANEGRPGECDIEPPPV
ncbi:FxSxx-COOH system tetratricopeptide repeat protein [Phytohabitans sp. ZYX-F-186]|uniref:FxSxx-COOH system tetratricopeptide repeat protein n=1 Tax=Phytohabitans maris TaxID=3071409 RepID=A0ABU0ZCX7_9ACTN|nr:FxSxx-COOH system tetratricopeptide repeat protein [Phytohabitans sp. ZYX-F-186]MDQ7904916.1 FxSxx-COOH system tetratricopeptide repeat protein [Phytohabitans sp. ZYX-F-186]